LNSKYFILLNNLFFFILDGFVSYLLIFGITIEFQPDLGLSDSFQLSDPTVDFFDLGYSKLDENLNNTVYLRPFVLMIRDKNGSPYCIRKREENGLFTVRLYYCQYFCVHEYGMIRAKNGPYIHEYGRKYAVLTTFTGCFRAVNDAVLIVLGFKEILWSDHIK